MKPSKILMNNSQCIASTSDHNFGHQEEKFAYNTIIIFKSIYFSKPRHIIEDGVLTEMIEYTIKLLFTK
jgi:hypothetical protein